MALEAGISVFTGDSRILPIFRGAALTDEEAEADAKDRNAEAQKLGIKRATSWPINEGASHPHTH
ncbi:MAG: hypothetical protein ACLP01_12105 [Solirubrobacteraceae bacterium]